ncbi:hypothetical protein [Pseudosporangium ferrugineum]|uniref:hypothetical protein n=1 Tax=Pseudosporangium ferrugineum TaxID=439699 RepID=UPI000D049561|nr:hypothetical protein [Pseudosporangium ferrugineum]
MTDVDGEPTSVPVDLLVPENLAAGRGRRSANLPEDGKNAARWTPALEATIFDHTVMPIASFEPEVDPRGMSIRIKPEDRPWPGRCPMPRSEHWLPPTSRRCWPPTQLDRETLAVQLTPTSTTTATTAAPMR